MKAIGQSVERDKAEEDMGPEEVAEKLEETMWTMLHAAVKSSLQPEGLLPDKYVHVTIRNVGLRTADEPQVHVRIPGVIVEHAVACDAYPEAAARVISVFGDTVPVGLVLDRESVPRLVPGAEMTIEIWYAEKNAGQQVVDTSLIGWPSELVISVEDSRAKGIRAEALHEARESGPELLVWLVGTLALGVLILTIIMLVVIVRGTGRKA
jgi:hypothetical protein